MNIRNKKTPAARSAGKHNSRHEGRTIHQKDELVKTSLGETVSKFSSAYDIATSNARISIESDRDYWQDSTLPNLVRLTDTADSHLLLSPAEALSVAAALQAVAVHLLEEAPEAAR